MADLRIRDRREMTAVLEAAMANAYQELSEQQRLLFGQNLVKTYLLEMDQLSPDGRWWAPVESGMSRIEPTRDGNLIVGFALYRSHGRQAEVAVIFDRISPRFLLCHSLAEAAVADAVIERLTATPAIDCFWLPTEMLEELGRLGALRGFGTRFDRSRFQQPSDDIAGDRVDGVDTLLPVESLKLKLWGSEAPAVLAALRETTSLRRAIAVSSVRTRYIAEGASDLFSLDELSFSGRITTRGTSYSVHREFAQRVADRYASQLEALEATHRIAIHDRQLLGAPAVLRIDPPLDPRLFVHVVLGGLTPFRLLGVPQELSKEYIIVPATDLHGGHRVDFEVAPNSVRIYLRGDACANTILRFQTNLQHLLSAQSVIN